MNTNTKIKLNMDALKTNKEWIRHKVKNGSNIFRILPPFGDNSNGYPYRKWQIIWGLTDPASGRVRPFASSLMSEKRDPVVEFVDGLRGRLDQMEGDLKARGLDDKAVQKHPKFARLAKFIRDVSPKTTYLYNAADKAGTIGLLELKATAHKDMKEKMNKYIRDYNQDPTSLNSADDDSGVWFDVTRSGEGFSTEYAVNVVQTTVKVNGKIMKEDDRSTLPESVVQNFDNLAYDLSSVYKANSYDDLNEILQANLDTFYKVCPEADLTVAVDLDAEDDAGEAAAGPAVAGKTASNKVVTMATSPAKPVTGKAPVALKLQDSDDEEVAPAPKAAKKAAPVVDDDEFMAQADAILKG